ncbi:B-cell receptor CD22-like [Simochromis diagramma]|uniref:B-cell receptor CD22-like n=1 Tax=Simochromis diagramma TaxID=43689 RepID=UPI001A7EA855|nr:B-cell receptor CD22-like [Simochromis diagramma]
MRGAAMSVITAVSGFVLLTVTVVLGQYGWGVTYTSTPICAVKGSTVELRCTFTYPSRAHNPYIVLRTFWLTKESNNEVVDLTTDPEYSGRVQYQCENNDCTLRISDLRESDSAEYKFRFITNDPGGKYTGSPGVTLTVTDLRVQVSRSAVSGVSKSADLKCESSCPLPDNLSYIWYKNERIIRGQTSNLHLNYLDPTNRISCAVRGYENSRSPSVVVKDVWDVTYSSTQVCAFKGATAEIRCTFRYPSTIDGRNTEVVKKFWSIRDENNKPVDLKTESEYRDRVEYQCEDNNCTLRISDLRESDSAEYKFRFITYNPGVKYSGVPGVTLTVTGPQLQVHVRRSTVNSYSNWTELTCHNNCQLPDQSSYIWYRNGHKLSSEKQYLQLNTFDSADSFHCVVKGYERFPSPTVYAPKLPSVSVSPSAEIVEGSSVTLTCSSDANPAANYTWYKEDVINPLSYQNQHVFSSILPSDSGKYYCTADNDLGQKRSESRTIDVKYAPKLPSVSVSPSAEIVEGSSVNLTCSSDANPAASYTWYKEDVINPLRYQNQHVFSSILPSDSGKYYCTADNNLGQKRSESRNIDVKYAPKLPSVSVSPSAEIVEGSSVTLTCSSDANPAASYTWYKDNKVLATGQKDVYHFISIKLENSGNYSCKSENQYGQKNSTSLSIDVQYPPKLPSVSVSPSAEIVEGSSVTLTCSSDANPAANYTWYKDNKVLATGQKDVYHFISIELENSGNYSCKSENQYGQKNSTSLSIDLPSVSVSPSAEIVEGSSVTLTCSSDANPAANYTWYKEDVINPLSYQNQHVFSSILPSDSGKYYCTADNDLGQKRSESRTIDVKYAPKLPSVSVSPSAEIVEGSSVNLTCSSDANPAASYTWYKEDVINPLRYQKQHVFSSILPSDSGKYYCTADNNLGQKRSESRNIDVKYAPKLPSVSVSPSAETVEGSSVTLTCSSDANPAASYTWYKDNKVLATGEKDVYHFISIKLENSGNYSCKSENQYGQKNSTSLSIDVQYAPKLPSVSVSPSAEIVEGSSVTLTCSSDANPAANYTWYKEDENSPKTSGHNFTISNIRPEHSGSYYCVTHNNRGTHNSTLQLTVVAGKSKIIIMNIIRLTLVVLILITLLVLSLLTRRKKRIILKTEPNEPVEMTEVYSHPD